MPLTESNVNLSGYSVESGVSMELKCQFTRQSVVNAIEQYQFDRRGKDAIFAFKERVLVHFAVDLTQVYMTTRLEGEKQRQWW